MVARKLRRSDIPGVLRPDEFAVSLPHTSAAQADIVARRLAKWFEPFSVIFGIASFPQDGLEAENLLLHAEDRAKEVGKDSTANPGDGGTFDPLLSPRLPRT